MPTKALCQNQKKEPSFRCKSTGCIVQLGHSITQFLPIIDDKPRISEAKWFNIGGSDISKLLIDEVEIPYDLDQASPFAQQKLNNFKERNCFVASDYRAEIEKHASEEEIRPESPQYLRYLKDSPIARMYQRLQKPTSKAIFEAPEILFEPSIAGKKDYGIAEQLYEMIGSVKPMGYHGLLYSNIILSGGNAKLKGLKERFAAEIDGYSPKLSKINVTFATDIHDFEEDDVEEGYVSTSTNEKSEISLIQCDISLAAFKGATILAKRPDFSSTFLMKKEDRPNLRRNLSRASVRSIRSSSYRKSSSTYLLPDFNEHHE
uniref:Actin-related protein n=1 Tax=Panagrolaimus davidi TaxID=227884 RepID=A0A914R6N7_9BILA